jgi:hypothetical protein
MTSAAARLRQCRAVRSQVAAHVSEDQLAVVVNAAAVVGAEIEDRSRGPIQRTAEASFFMECVCP